jgi:flagellar protein FliO/FliZ
MTSYPFFLANIVANPGWSRPIAGLAGAPAASSGELILRMFGGMLLVLAVMFAAVWALKRWRFLPGANGGKAHLKLVESKTIGARQSIMVVGYDEKRFLVATTSQGVSLLTNLPDAAPELESEKAPESAKFGEFLLAAIQQKVCR